MNDNVRAAYIYLLSNNSINNEPLKARVKYVRTMNTELALNIQLKGCVCVFCVHAHIIKYINEHNHKSNIHISASQ